MSSPTAIVSACLLGLCTRYDGKDALDTDVVSLSKQYALVPICPEQLGGLPTPRPRANICGGNGTDVLEGRASVLTDDGTDLSAAFIRGATEALKAARICNAQVAFLKEKSPSCGTRTITRRDNDSLVEAQGPGVCSALLSANGIVVKAY